MRAHFIALILLFATATALPAADSARQIIARAIAEEEAGRKLELIRSLSGSKDAHVQPLLAAWEADRIFIYQAADDAPKIPVLLTGAKDTAGTQAALRLEDATPLLDATGQPARITASETETAPHNSAIRRAMKTVTDLLALERGIIRFLYRRPLESLLATWGVSLVLQQLFRMIFGANNVQVSSPAYLSGNWTVGDVILGWNRVFVIGFATVIVLGTHFVLTKTSLGLLIRAVMQNRQMAACMGVKTERVNMLTFCLGSGLAGLAGAFLSQIGNVGPSLGQGYIVDCFMTVVVGGVGNIVGTVISALAIGITDQSLQQMLANPVLGKILVLVGIILFLQWRPAGLFVTKSRSLES